MMTRETRVGLLAGLTVIVVFAMILSHKGNQPNAQLPSGVFQPPRDVLVQQTEARPAVPMSDATLLPPSDTDRDRPAPQNAMPASLPQSAAAGSLPPALQDSTRFELVTPPPSANSPERPGDNDFLDNLRRRLEGSAPPPPRQGQVPSTRDGSASPGGDTPGGQEGQVYVAQSNDTLTSIARKTMGTDSMDAVRAIFQLNRDQLKDMDSIYAGQKLRIPGKQGRSNDLAPRSGPGVSRGDRGDGQPAHSSERETAAPTARNRSRQHTVKPGESYSRIAEQYLGDPRRWREIYELNKAKYPDADALPHGAVIAIPEAEKKLAQR